MSRKLFLIGVLFALSALITACGTSALPQYDKDSTSVAVARTETREALLTEGAIIPSDTPTITPSPTVDFEATAAAEQATLDAEATITAEFEATSAAEAEAANEQAIVDAQATSDAEAEAAAAVPGSDDPLFDAIAAADVANGELLFASNSITPCTTCHLANSEDMLVGPGQLHVLERVIERIENGTIEAEGPYSYLYDSIINPNDYITEGFPAAMPDVYEDGLSEQEIYDLVAYLASLGE